MRVTIPTPPSVNNPQPYAFDYPIPPGKFYKVAVVVALPLGDVDNRIKPVLDVLARNGLKKNRIVEISCRFGIETTVEVEAVDF